MIDVTKLRMKKVSTLEDAEINVVGLIECHLKIEKGSINLDQVEYAVPITFQGFETIIVFSKHDPTGAIRIRIMNELTQDEPCLDLRIGEKSGKIVGKIGFVRTKSGRPMKCTVPETKAAAWMITLADQIYCMFGLQYAFLEDDAVLPCESTTARFLLLRIFQGKFSYYESFNYSLHIRSQPDISSDYDRQAYEEDARYLRAFFVADLVKFVDTPAGDTVKMSTYAAKVLEEKRLIAKKVLRENEHLGKTLGDLMPALWTKNCIDYVHVISFMNTAARKDIDGTKGSFYSFAPALRRITYIGTEYLKALKCM